MRKDESKRNVKCHFTFIKSLVKNNGAELNSYLGADEMKTSIRMNKNRLNPPKLGYFDDGKCQALSRYNVFDGISQ